LRAKFLGEVAHVVVGDADNRSVLRPGCGRAGVFAAATIVLPEQVLRGVEPAPRGGFNIRRAAGVVNPRVAGDNPSVADVRRVSLIVVMDLMPMGSVVHLGTALIHFELFVREEGRQLWELASVGRLFGPTPTI
jgi:hypothetical protein